MNSFKLPKLDKKNDENYFGIIDVVKDFGVVPNSDEDCSKKIQAAVDYAGKLNQPVVIQLPAGHLKFNSSVIINVDNITIQGAGIGTSYEAIPNFGGPAFCCGIGRTGQMLQRVDGYDLLDKTLVPTEGKWMGIKFDEKSGIQSIASRFSAGVGSLENSWFLDHYGEMRNLTVELAVVPGTPVGEYAPVLTLGQYWGIYQSRNDNTIILFIQTSDTPGGPLSKSYWPLKVTKNELTKFTWQINLEEKKVTGYIDGVETNFNYYAGELKSHFFINESKPFLIGCEGDRRISNGYNSNMTLYGLLISNSIRYKSNGNGTPQERVDNGTLTDLYRYNAINSQDPFVLGSLMFDGNPNSRQISIKINGLESIAWIIDTVGGYGIPTYYTKIKNMVILPNRALGISILTGHILDPIFENLYLYGYYGISAFPGICAYTVDINRCFIDAQESAIFASDWLVRIKETSFVNSGRTTIRATASNIEASEMFVSFGNNVCNHFLRVEGADYGGNTDIRKLLINFEGNVYRKSVFRLDSFPYEEAKAIFEDIDVGSTGPIPIFELDGAANTWGKKARLFIDRMKCGWGQATHVVKNNSDKWNVKVGDVWGLGPNTIVQENTFESVETPVK